MTEYVYQIREKTLEQTIVVFSAYLTFAKTFMFHTGKWALYCHTHHHLMAGMTSTYSVNVCQGAQSLPVVPMKPSGGVRRYYIAAVEIEWNYAPSGIDKIVGKPLTDEKA